MEVVVYIVILLLSCYIFYFTGGWILTGVTKISYRLGWREFALAFLVIASTASLPNFFVGITSALNQVPELSFGDVVGGNLIALTIAAPLALFFSSKKEIFATSRTVQWSLVFMVGAALLPSVLVINGELGRLDGLILIGLFFVYIGWLFYKRERFMLRRKDRPATFTVDPKLSAQDIYRMVFGLILIVVASQGIVRAATFFAETFGMSLLLIGVLIVGVGNALPQIYFASSASYKGDNWILLGSVMGSVVIPATLVLGMVALIQPITVDNLDIAMVGRIFLAVAAVMFFWTMKTGQKMVIQEAFLLLSIYVIFLLYVFFVH